MEFFVYSRAAIENIAPHNVPHVIISISSDDEPPAKLPVNDLCREVLRLSFRDVDVPSEQHPEHTLFSRDHATQIWQMVSRHRDDAQRVVVHCNAGFSRSPAVAAALSKVIVGDDMEFFRRYRPNMRVYRMLLEACDEADIRRQSSTSA